jgi:ligand-binding SRPBCC domain-containing protein
MSNIISRETFIPRPLDEVFEFFSKAENLNTLTPPELSFSILTPLPVVMRPGTIIDYRIRLMNIPFKWKTLISRWEPGSAFVDEQLKGPYKKWIHLHSFEACEGGTKMMDRVEYDIPGGVLAYPVLRWFVRPKVEAIFDYREKALRNLFP